MKRLCFKKIYLDDILSGVKKTTVRKPYTQLPRQGETVSLVIGRFGKPFAIARITEELSIALDSPEIDDAHRKDVRKIYPDYEGPFTKLSFVLKTTC